MTERLRVVVTAPASMMAGLLADPDLAVSLLADAVDELGLVMGGWSYWCEPTDHDGVHLIGECDAIPFQVAS